MYTYTLSTQQRTEARTALCHEERCLRCDTPLPDAEHRLLGMFPSVTRKHRYVNCIILCQDCEQDREGTKRWFFDLDEQEALNMAKDRSCFVAQVS